jgi:hypothetical protein
MFGTGPPMPEMEYLLTAEPCEVNPQRLPSCPGGTCNGCLGDGTRLVWSSAIRVKRVTVTSVAGTRVGWVVYDKAKTQKESVRRESVDGNPFPAHSVEAVRPDDMRDTDLR